VPWLVEPWLWSAGGAVASGFVWPEVLLEPESI
jgi:hypothetical protein